MKKIIHLLRINSTPEKIYWALTTKEGLEGWWSTNVQAPSTVGDIIRFRFVDEFSPDMKITTLEKNKEVKWTCIQGAKDWTNNNFSFELKHGDGLTHLLFVQDYAHDVSDEVYGNYNFNWAYYLGSLQKLCETGKGTPFKAT